MTSQFIGDTGCTVGTGRTEINLSGTAITSPDTHRTFASGLTNGDWVTVTVSKSAGNVSTVTGQYTTGTPNKLTSLTWSDELGTISAADTVDCFVINDGLVSVPQAGDAAISGAPGAWYRLDISGFTANRAFTLPSGSAGDKIRVSVETGSGSFCIDIKGSAGVSINGGTAASTFALSSAEGDVYDFECTSANNWACVSRQFTPLVTDIVASTTRAITSYTFFKLSHVDSVSRDLTGAWDTTNKRVNVPAGSYAVSIGWSHAANSQKVVALYKNGVEVMRGNSDVGHTFQRTQSFIFDTAAPAYLEAYGYSSSSVSLDADTNYNYFRITRMA